MDTQTQLSNSKDHVRMLYDNVSKMKEIAEHMVVRSTGFATDMLTFGRQLRYVALWVQFLLHYLVFIYTLIYACVCVLDNYGQNFLK